MSGYKVTKVGPIDEEGAKGAIDFGVSFYDHDPIAKVRLYADGCIKFVWLDPERIKLGIQGWFYTDESQGVYDALGEALRFDRKRRRRRASQREIDEFVGHKKGHSIDLNRDDTVKLLRHVRWRKHESDGVEIEYNGKWLRLGRTDLVDDVRTGVSWDSEEDCCHPKYYLKRVAFGARITDTDFLVIDAMTDG